MVKPHDEKNNAPSYHQTVKSVSTTHCRYQDTALSPPCWLAAKICGYRKCKATMHHPSSQPALVLHQSYCLVTDMSCNFLFGCRSLRARISSTHTTLKCLQSQSTCIIGYWGLLHVYIFTFSNLQRPSWKVPCLYNLVQQLQRSCVSSTMLYHQLCWINMQTQNPHPWCPLFFQHTLDTLFPSGKSLPLVSVLIPSKLCRYQPLVNFQHGRRWGGEVGWGKWLWDRAVQPSL